MKIKCDYCGNYIDDADEKCFWCGAPNGSKRRSGTGAPKTIEELQQWYLEHELPDEATTRFFIGEDYSGPKAFGIFKKPSGDVVVYKNKTDGTRMTRYIGRDEEYAVNEIYIKLKEEIAKQKLKNESPTLSRDYSRSFKSSEDERDNSSKLKSKNKLIIFLIIVIVLGVIYLLYQNRRGFHYYGGNSGYSSNYYYNDNNNGFNWFGDDDDDYSYHSSYDSSSSSWSSNDWDSDYSWDSYDSWDSGWSDWDSDW